MTTIVRGLVIFITLTLAWHALTVIYQIPSYLLPSPVQIADSFYHSYPVIIQHAGYTLLETLLGLTLGVFFGCFAGWGITYFRSLRAWFWPVLIISQALPVFAIAPLLVIWLGYGLASKVAAATLMVFFPVTSALHDGLRRTDSGWMDLAATMNARPLPLFWLIRLPAALPALASGVRIAAVAAPMGAIIGEWVGSSNGLGYLMINANARMQTDMMFAALAGIMMLTLGLYYSIDWLLRSLITWEPKELQTS